MKRPVYILLLFGFLSRAQTALYNSGHFQIHEEGQLGFHTNLINGAPFDENLGLAGFYAPLSVSGPISPLFYDLEILSPGVIALQTGVGVQHNANFINGTLTTPRTDPDTTFGFSQEAFYTGGDDASKVDGYVSVVNQSSFMFPVGDAAQFRPLHMEATTAPPLSRCAYFFEDPNAPSTFPQGFDTSRKPATMGPISETEFWYLEGSTSASVDISWNARSDMAAITDDASTVIVVGFNKNTRRWEDLGGSGVGDLEQGFVTSNPFIPDNYAALTFGNIGVPEERMTLDNYYVSPNGDGINDFLYIEELEQSPNHLLQIYDRFGLKVYESTDYQDGFRGYSNIDNGVLDREKGLPSGVYFYLVSMYDLDLNFQGFLYLTPH